ncbi:MAG: 3-phosphoserine/phosphohydroxythreonine transaminase [Candidatus Lindowbacteria bacterium]|nr:3-phosphoserine/phosphohydroxythreonine transaminase [Candidatus Lindowbacteria bacterium]
MGERVYNFSAGPAVLPVNVLEEAQKDLVNYKGCGMSVMELSHRSKEYDDIHERAINGTRRILGVPDDYAVLFLQGGASLQFSMIPMNLCQEGKPVDMIHTGQWTKKAIPEVKRVATMNMAGSSEEDGYRSLPKLDELKLDPNASYVHICSNNTVAGTQFKKFPDTGDVPLVADMSSDIVSRPVNVSNFGMIFAGAQKNIGPAGVTMVIMKNDLADRCPEDIATMLQYRTHIKGNSLYNTPPTFGIYIIALVMEHLEKLGGLDAVQEANEKKAAILYDAIEENDFYYCPVEEESRSLMNVVYRIKGDNEELEAKFISESKAARFTNLKGHRSVGGLRASIYNAQPEDSIKALVKFMEDFASQNG